MFVQPRYVVSVRYDPERFPQKSNRRLFRQIFSVRILYTEAYSVCQSPVWSKCQLCMCLPQFFSLDDGHICPRQITYAQNTRKMYVHMAISVCIVPLVESHTYLFKGVCTFYAVFCAQNRRWTNMSFINPQNSLGIFICV